MLTITQYLIVLPTLFEYSFSIMELAIHENAKESIDNIGKILFR